jgi:cell wall-associated NlpC family hydrolase
MMGVVTSANDMKRVYLTIDFLNFQMKLFFRLKSSQKLLLPITVFATLFLASCASHRVAKVKEEKVDRVISTAKTYMGTPYKYGGTTRSGMDCSGLLLNSFRAIEVTLPRTSEAQSKIGKEVKIKELQPGDLLFFATGKKKKEITHVGLVTDVKRKDNVKFIHASTSLGVVETNLYTDYYITRFRKARRVIQ